MLESGLVKGGQSLGMVDAGKLPESRKWCTGSRRHCFFFVLVLAAVLFFFNTDIKGMAPDWKPKWWKQYNNTDWWSPFRSQSLRPPPPKASHSRAPGSASDQTSSSTSPPPTTVTRTTTARQTTQNNSVPPTPVPYVSPGPYLVEYPYEYRFVINEPQTCEQQKPFLVLMVPVAPHNRAHRDIIRKTWGSESLVLNKVVKLFFLLGLHKGEGAEKIQEQVLQESKEHRDLIQSDYLDCYKNLTIKTMMMLEWLDGYCSNASYAMKIDSDTFLNVQNLVNMLLNAPRANYMTGLVARGAAVLRDPHSKWYLPVDVYPHWQYPRYALGLGYVLSLDLPKKLVGASRHVKAIYIEDVYLGLCMQHLGIGPTDPPNWGFFNNVPIQYNRCSYFRVIAALTTENTDRVAAWTDFKKPGPYC